MDGFVLKGGVWVHPGDAENYAPFQNAYLALRKAENRLYADADVKSLPRLLPDRWHAAEWRKRANTADSFMNWLGNCPPNLSILDFGCGNGWFANIMAREHRVTGVDVNLTELQQAVRCFGNERTTWCLAGIENLPASTYSVITLNAAVQYFEDLSALITTLLQKLEPDGSIHLMDSPFYSAIEKPLAKERSRLYFAGKGFPEMAGHYFHHCWDDLEPFHYRIRKKPQGKLSRSLFTGRSPFAWVSISHAQLHP